MLSSVLETALVASPSPPHAAQNLVRAFKRVSRSISSVFHLTQTFTGVLKLRRYLNLSLLARAPASLQTPPGASFSLAVTSTNGTAARSRVMTFARVSAPP